jgi:DNA polymerase-3 subunit delta'
MLAVPRLTEADIEQTLIDKYSVLPAEARRIARSSAGNMAQALRTITSDAESDYYFELFVELMRLAYVRKVKEMKVWSDRVAGMGRERIKAFLEYCQRMVRENFIYNFQRQSDLNYMTEQEALFAVKFAPFINERNVIGIMDELSLAQRDVGQNTNPKIVFFDFALKMIVLIKNR